MERIKGVWAKFKALPDTTKGLFIFFGLACCSFGLSRCEQKPVPAPGFTKPAPIPAAAAVPEVVVPVTKIVALDKKKLQKKMPLPEVITQDPKVEVVTTADLPAGPGYSVVAFTNTSTGRTELLSQPKPRPFLALEQDAEVGIRYGLTTAGGQAGDVYARYSFLRVGGAHLAVYGEVSTKPAAKAMAEISYRW